MPIILITVIVSCILLHLHINQGSRKLAREKEAFWKRERDANLTRRKDISDLPYIKIPLNQLPITDTDNESLKSIQDAIIQLSTQPILNLSGLSNTDLKLEYGAANIGALTAADNNYTSLLGHLYKWGSLLNSLGEVQNAKAVLEYGIQCHTDISKHYILLATIYKEEGNLSKIDELIASVDSLNTLMKSSIKNSLADIRN